MKKLNAKKAFFTFFNIMNPLFLIYLAYLIFIKQYQGLLAFFATLAIHESVHYAVAKKLGYKAKKISFMPFGVSLNYNKNVFFGNDELYVALSAPFVNLLICFCTVALWWIVPELYSTTQIFCLCNLVFFCYNILPCYPLDGGRVLVCLLSKKYSRAKAVKVALAFNLFFCCVLIFVFFVSLLYGIFNANLLIVAIFLLLSIIEPKNSTCYDYLCNDYSVNNKQVRQVKIIAVSSQIMLYKIFPKLHKNKYNIVYVISKNNGVKIYTESTLFCFSIENSPLCTMEELMLKKM